MLAEKVKERHQAKFGHRPNVYFSPGRVNLIGEHTDYNQGFVMPGAVEQGIYVSFAPRADQQVRAYAMDLDEEVTFSLTDLSPQKASWVNYLVGYLHRLSQRGIALPHGFDTVVTGDVPLGAGMSSSAAYESAVGCCLSASYQLDLPAWDRAKLGQEVENHFIGLQSGIMDQFASVFGQRDHVLLLDCRSLEFQPMPLSMADHRLVLVNTMVKHELAGSEYNTRRLECERAVAHMKQHHAEVESLRDVTSEMLTTQNLQGLDSAAQRRMRYIVEENSRVTKTTDALAKKDLAQVGELMQASHHGLSQDYEVSCRELDTLVRIAQQHSGWLGGRMMGGGFGGCTINLVQAAQVDDFRSHMVAGFEQALAVTPETYVVKLGDGSRKLD